MPCGFLCCFLGGSWRFVSDGVFERCVAVVLLALSDGAGQVGGQVGTRVHQRTRRVRINKTPW